MKNSKDNSEKYCDKFLDIFYKCNIVQDSYTYDRCNKIKLLFNDNNLSFLNLYLKCEENRRLKCKE